MPVFLKTPDGEDLYHYEVIIPLKIELNNIIGFRGSKNSYSDPIFLRKGFEIEDKSNFWELIQIMGGKSQYVNFDFDKRMKSVAFCKNLFTRLYTGKN